MGCPLTEPGSTQWGGRPARIGHGLLYPVQRAGFEAGTQPWLIDPRRQVVNDLDGVPSGLLGVLELTFNAVRGCQFG
jgi:hypothetical protein